MYVPFEERIFLSFSLLLLLLLKQSSQIERKRRKKKGVEKSEYDELKFIND
jgi:hypothetical protein